MKKSNSSVAQFVVVDGNGNIDVDASLAAFEAELQKHVDSRGVLTRAVAQAVNEVFDEYPGCNFNTPALISFAMRKFSVDIVKDSYDILETAIKDYVHNCPNFLVQKKVGIRRI
jgi:hypothetical protein